jgi:hypothetical protein
MRLAGFWTLGAILAAGMAWGQPVSKQIAAGDAAVLFGGADAEGGIGDWYLSNGVVQAIVDDVGPAADLVGVVPPGQVPPMQSEINPTGGTLIDLGRAGQDGDELSQFLTVGGLSTSFFILYDTVSAPSPGIVRASGRLLLPPVSDRPAPCIDVVTDYAALGSDPFLTLTTTQTNRCGVPVPSATGASAFLDVVPWTQRGIVPFSAGASVLGGRGFDHPALDIANPASALELPTFIGAPGMLRAEDGVMDPVDGSVSNPLAYGLVPVRTEFDADGPGGADPVVTPAGPLFGISSPLVTGLGVSGPALPPGASFTYVRHLYVGASADVRAVSDPIITALAARDGFGIGTISGDVDAVDTPDVPASIVIKRIGNCTANPARLCTADDECDGEGPCADLQPATGFAHGGAVTHVRTDAAGRFSGVVLPRGVYELVVSAPERDVVVLRGATVDTGDNPVVIPPLSPRGLVRFAVREKAKGRPMLPAKLVFKGAAAGTPDPRFRKDLNASLGGVDVEPETYGGTERGPEGDARGQGNVVYTASGTGSIHVRPGTYDVYATRGPEYGIARRRVVVESGRTTAVDFRLKRVIRTRDALAADFHVHSGRSLDSSAPLEDRVVSFAAEGVEVMVSTDHDKQVDYGPVIGALALGSRVASIPGVEVTGSVPNPPTFPNSIGHLNAWPLPLAPDARRDGAIDDEYVAPNWIYARLRAQAGPDVVVQYNHPRAGVAGLTSIGFFNSIGCNRCSTAIDTSCTTDLDCPGAGGQCTCVGFQPERPLGMPPNDILLDTGVLGPGSTPNPMGLRNLDFDVMEVANGAKVGDWPAYLQVREDWFALLAQGVLKPGTGVSDSHRLTVEHAGWARTYVLGAGDDPAAFDRAAFDRNVKAGRMVVSAGPWVRATIRGRDGVAGPGDTAVSPTGRVRLKVDVRSAAWIPIDEVRVVTIRRFGEGGIETRRFDATTRPRVRPAPANFQSSGATSRFRGSIPIQYPSDYLVLVEAGPALGGTPVSPAVVDAVEPDVVPLAFTNPIRVDVGGDGFALAQGAPVRGGPAPGRMTGVTRAARVDAVRRGDYFPLHDFQLDLDAVRRLRR